MSLEELLALREHILDAKLNLTYYIEESDSDSDDIDGLMGGLGMGGMGAAGMPSLGDIGGDGEPELDFDDEEDGIFDDAVEDEDENEAEDGAKAEKPQTAESLFKLRKELIEEIKGQMMEQKNKPKSNSWSSTTPNITYDLAEGHHLTMSGSMNHAIQDNDGIAENITYDLAEGHHAKLKGSMNGQASNSALDLEHHLLSLRQGPSTGGNIS